MLGLIGGCAVMTALLKGAGPIALGGRELPPWFSAIVALMAPALFAALVVTQVLADGQDIGVGADTAGVAWRAWRRGAGLGDLGGHDRRGHGGGAAGGHVGTNFNCGIEGAGSAGCSGRRPKTSHSLAIGKVVRRYGSYTRQTSHEPRSRPIRATLWVTYAQNVARRSVRPASATF